MISKRWDGKKLADIAAEIDAELEEIFSEVDEVSAHKKSERNLPQAEILPDDFDDKDEPPSIEILPDDFDENDDFTDYGKISPAATSEIFDVDFTLKPKIEWEKEDIPAPEQKKPPQEDEANDPAYFPKAHYKDFKAATVGSLSPDDFGSLIERAVERAILSAIAKAGL